MRPSDKLAELALSVPGNGHVRSTFATVLSVDGNWVVVKPDSMETGSMGPLYVVTGVLKANDRTLITYLPDNNIWVAWGKAKTAVGCPDLTGLNPVDKSFTLDFTWTNTGGGDLHRHYGSGTYVAYPGGGYPNNYVIPAGRGWCVQDLSFSVEILAQDRWWPNGGVQFGYSWDSYPVSDVWVAGDSIAREHEGRFIFLTSGSHVRATSDSVALTGGTGTGRFRVSWTATEFDL